jgi:uncharacterized membrane protein YhdT
MAGKYKKFTRWFNAGFFYIPLLLSVVAIRFLKLRGFAKAFISYKLICINANALSFFPTEIL